MDEFQPIPDHMLRRLPGLFRRWEFAQVIEAGKDYRVEDAGSACDGTTLYAVYVSAPVAAEATVEECLETASGAELNPPAIRLEATRKARAAGPDGILNALPKAAR